MSESQGAKKRIAVIAVHGVGDHEQFATAREIGDLLSNLEYQPSRTPRYSPFTEVVKRIHVRPVRVADKGPGFDWTDENRQRRTWGPMDALARAAFRREPAARPESSEPDNSEDSLDHLFMKGQLIKAAGESPEDTYQCLRLQGKRVSPAAAAGAPAQQPAADAAGEIALDLRERGVELPPVDAEQAASPGTQEKIVHIYEMYWADLSRLSNAFTQVFGELYQLLFHLGTISVNNVLAASIHFQGREPGGAEAGKKWHLFSTAQRLAAAILAWPIPILNLYMAALVPVILLISMMRLRLSPQGEFVALDALVGLLCVAGCGYAFSKARTVPRRLFAAPLFVIGALCIATAFLPCPWKQDRTEEICAIVTLGLALGAGWMIIQAYDRQRPGSKKAAGYVGGILLVAVMAAFAAGGIPVGKSWGYPAIAMSLNVMEIAFGLQGLAWALFYAFCMWAHWAGWRAVSAVQCDPPEYKKARGTRWTAQLVLALSSVVFFILTLTVWTGAIKVASGLLPGQKHAAAFISRPQKSESQARQPDSLECTRGDCRPVQYEPVSAALYRFVWGHGLRRAVDGVTAGIPKKLIFDPARNMELRAEGYTEWAPLASEWADQMLLAAGIGSLPILLAAVLVALLFTVWALFPSVADELSPPDSGSAAGELSRESVSLGVWLDRGIRFMRWGGELLYWTIWLPSILFVLFNFTFIDWIYAHWQLAVQFIEVAGTLVAGTALGMLGFAGRINSFAQRFRPLLRVMLDVDNWLREHPRASNPTARICGRYVSLLRHISEWRDSDGKSKYEAMVIIAHSQGTVITADFLRFLQVEKRGSIGDYDPELKLFDAHFPIYLFTMGCPLRQLYGLRFPYLYGWARQEAAAGAAPPGKIPDIGADDAPRPDRLGVRRWINAYRSGDYVGRYLWRGGEAGYEWDPANVTYEEEWDPPAGKPAKVSADQAGRRIEFCIGPGAHTHYWDHTAGLIAEVLDRLITTA